MADLADELLGDLELAPAPEHSEEPNTASGGADASPGRTGKRKAHEADLDDLDDLGGEDEDEDDNGDGQAGEQEQLELGPNSVAPAQELDQATIEAMDLGPTAAGGQAIAVEKLLSLPGSKRLAQALAQVEAVPPSTEAPDGVLEETPEYQLLVQSNNLIVELDNEMRLAHKLIRDQYRPRFPQLETLIPDPWEFMQAVAALANRPRLGDAKLEGILPAGTITVISIEASKTSGERLPDQAWDLVQRAIDAVGELEQARRRLLSYVESRVSLIAPNLSALVGARVATQLLGVAGGLTPLAKMPSCNLLLLGAPKASTTSAAVVGLSTAHSGKHRGLLSHASLVAQTPEEYRTQALRMLSAKAVLAARVDTASPAGGAYGEKLHAEVARKIEKLMEPPPSKMTKALPVPKEGGRKQRRGGRQARKRKERYGMTEARKMANRVQFGVEEQEADAFGDAVGMGMINQASGGRVRALQADAKSRAKLSKRHAQRIEQMRNGGGQHNPSAILDAPVQSSLDGLAEHPTSAPPPSSGLARLKANQDAITAGMASSITFTPAQGIELVNPSALKKQRVDEANQKWFRQGTFSLLPGQGSGQR